MDLKEIKKLTAFARKNGIKSLKVAGCEIEFGGEVVPRRTRRLKIVEEAMPREHQEPTLQQINDFIYNSEAVDIA